MKKKIGKVEVGRKHGTPVPGYTPELGTRIAHAIERIGGLKIAAGIINVSEDSLAQWRDGKARPSFFGLSQLAKEASVSLDWLADGQEAGTTALQPSEPVAQIDQRLMGRCSDAFGKLYKELGIALSLADLGALAAEAYNDLVAAEVTDMDIPTQLVVIRSLVERHRRELLAEADANAKGKRSAS